MRDILLFFLDDIENCYKEVMVAILFLPLMVPITFLVVLVFFASLALVSRRLLGMLLTKYINGKSVNRLIFYKVFFLYFCRLVILETPSINLLDARK